MQTTASTEVIDFIIMVLIAGNLFAVLIGVMMVVAPGRLDAWSRLGNTWISTRKLLKPLEVSRDTDTAMLRYPRVLGAVLLAGAVLILIKGWMFIAGISAVDGGRILARFFAPTKLAAGAWETLWVSMIVLIALGALSALAVGLLSLFKVEILKKWSDVANRWVSTQRALKPLDRPHYGLDRIIRGKPRIWGGIITAFALYTLVMLLWFVRAG